VKHTALGIIVLTACLVGCGDDATTAVDAGPTGPMSVSFASPASGGDPACVSIGDDADITVPLLVKAPNIDLSPPGDCKFDQCGHLELFAADILNNEGAVPAIELLIYKIADRYHDGSESLATGMPDVLPLRIDVIRDGEPLLSDELGADGEPLPVSDTIDLITVPDCDALPEN
jgi:hypothetical protein